MTDEFVLIGHISTVGGYPSPVVPIGEHRGRLVAAYPDGRGLVDIDSDAPYERHSGLLRSQLASFDAERDRLFAFSDQAVVKYACDEEATFFRTLLGEHRVEEADPFVRLAFAERTRDGETIVAEIKRCGRWLRSTLPARADAWFSRETARLRQDWDESKEPLLLPDSLDDLLGTEHRRRGFAGTAGIRRTVAIVVDSIEEPYQREVAAGATEAANEAHANAIVLVVGGQAGAQSIFRTLSLVVRDENVHGIILLSGALKLSSTDVEVLADLYRQRPGGHSIPVVSVAVRSERVSSLTVDADDVGLVQAITHLVQDHRFRRIGLIAGPPENADAFHRQQTFRRVLEEKGLFNSALVASGDFLMPSGAAAMQKLLRVRPDIEAVVAANDAMAMGAQAELKAQRKESSVAVIGYDDIPEARVSVPSLSTVRQPLGGQGRKAFELLMELMTHHANMAPGILVKHATLTTQFAERHSCGEHKAEGRSDRETLRRQSRALSIAERTVVALARSFQKNEAIFLKRLESLLQQSRPEDFWNWYEALAELREYVIPREQRSMRRLTRAEALLHRANRMIATAAQERRLREKLSLQARKHTLSVIGRELITAQLRGAVIDVLRKEMPKISSMYCLCFYVDADAAVPQRSHLALHTWPSGTSGPNQGAEDVTFAASEIVPADLIDPNRAHSFLVAPLLQDRALGYLAVEIDADADWTLYQDLAQQIGQALERTRLTEKHVQGQAAFAGITTIDGTFRQVLMSYARFVKRESNADIVVIYPYFKEDNVFPVRSVGPASAGVRNVEMMKSVVLEGDAVHAVLEQGTNIFVDDTRLPPPELASVFQPRPEKGQRFFVREGVRSVAAMILRWQDKVVGIMFVNFRSVVSLGPMKQRLALCAEAVGSALGFLVMMRGENRTAVVPLSIRQTRLGPARRPRHQRSHIRPRPRADPRG